MVIPGSLRDIRQHRLDDFQVIVSQRLGDAEPTDGHIHELLVFTVWVRYDPVVKLTEAQDTLNGGGGMLLSQLIFSCEEVRSDHILYCRKGHEEIYDLTIYNLLFNRGWE